MEYKRYPYTYTYPYKILCDPMCEWLCDPMWDWYYAIPCGALYIYHMLAVFCERLDPVEDTMRSHVG